MNAAVLKAFARAVPMVLLGALFPLLLLELLRPTSVTRFLFLPYASVAVLLLVLIFAPHGEISRPWRRALGVLLALLSVGILRVSVPASGSSVRLGMMLVFFLIVWFFWRDVREDSYAKEE